VGKHWRVRRADLASMIQPTPHPVLVPPMAQAPEAATDVEAEAHPDPTPDPMHPQLRKAALVARLRELKAQGLTLQAIANQLNAEGEPTLTHKGTWQKGTVGNLLAQV
jgi:hypothetical protein